MDAMSVNTSEKTVGAELARDGGGSACIDVECAAAIASKLSSHSFFGCVHRHRIHPQSLCASLLAMVAAHSTSMQADPPLSRASSAPTVFSGLLTDIASIPNPCGSRACSRWRRHIQYRCKQAHRHREQAQLPQFFRVCSQTSHPSPIPVGASLLAIAP